MTRLTRRKFFRQASLGAAAVGTMAILPGAATTVFSSKTEQKTDSTLAKSSDPNPYTATFTGPLVAHIRDHTTGEISLMVGTKEVVYHDREMVTRLIQAAHQ